MMTKRGQRPGTPGGGASALLLLQDLVQLVCVLGGLHSDQQRDGAAGILVIHRWVGNAHQHHVVLAHSRARDGRLHDDVEQDVSCGDTAVSSHPVVPLLASDWSDSVLREDRKLSAPSAGHLLQTPPTHPGWCRRG